MRARSLLSTTRGLSNGPICEVTPRAQAEIQCYPRGMLLPKAHSPTNGYYDTARLDLLGWAGRGGSRILEIGCGSGANAGWLKLHGAEWLEGVEPHAPAAEVARTQFDVIHASTIEDTKLDGVFDLIICADVLEHLVDPAGILARLHAVASPEGSLLVSTPNIRHYRALIRIAFGAGFGRTLMARLTRPISASSPAPTYAMPCFGEAGSPGGGAILHTASLVAVCVLRLPSCLAASQTSGSLVSGLSRPRPRHDVTACCASRRAGCTHATKATRVDSQICGVVALQFRGLRNPRAPHGPLLGWGPQYC